MTRFDMLIKSRIIKKRFYAKNPDVYVYDIYSALCQKHNLL